jgi:hypothetical protein
MRSEDINLQKGEILKIETSFEADDGTQFDISGFTITMKVKRSLNDSDLLYTIAFTATNAQAGEGYFQITSTHTSEPFEGVYDISLVNGTQTIKSLVGTFRVNESV